MHEGEGRVGGVHGRACMDGGRAVAGGARRRWSRQRSRACSSGVEKTSSGSRALRKTGLRPRRAVRDAKIAPSMACWDFPPTGGDDKCTGVGDARKCLLRDLSTSTFATDVRLGLVVNASFELLVQSCAYFTDHVEDCEEQLEWFDEPNEPTQLCCACGGGSEVAPPPPPPSASPSPPPPSASPSPPPPPTPPPPTPPPPASPPDPPSGPSPPSPPPSPPAPPQQPLNSPQFELIAEGQQCTGDETTLLVKYINKLL